MTPGDIYQLLDDIGEIPAGLWPEKEDWTLRAKPLSHTR